MRGLHAAVVGLVLAALGGGCGVGIGQAAVRGTVSRNDDNWLDSDRSEYFQDNSIGITRANTVTFYDSTGMMLAALGTAGNAYNAQQDAEAAAIRGGAEAGDTYSYEYDVVEPAAGTNTRLTFAWGSTENGSVSGPLGNGDVGTGQQIDYFQMDLRATLGGYDLEGGGRWNFNLGALWESWTGKYTLADGSEHELGVNWIGMPVGTTVTYPLFGPISITGGVAIDPLMSLLSGLLGGGGHWVFLEGSARLDFRPVNWLLIWTGAAERVAPWDFGKRTGETTVFDVGIAFMYGM